LISKLAKLAFILGIIVVTLGALTRLLDAGLGCPDWPGCYGQITPPDSSEHTTVDQGKAWMEMIHRYAASTLGLVILIIAFTIHKDPSTSAKARTVSRVLLALVIVQGLFGMWTVTLKLLPQIVTLHLIGGMTVLATTFWLNLLLCKKPRPVIHNKPTVFAILALVLLSCQIALGGWTSSTYSGLACTDFPTCDGHVVPPLVFDDAFHITEFSDRNYEGGHLPAEARVTIQYIHRVMALIVTITLLTLFFKLRQIEALKPQANILLGFLILQLSLGISTAVMMLPLPLALLHNTGAALLLLAVVNINHILFSEPQLTESTNNTGNS